MIDSGLSTPPILFTNGRNVYHLMSETRRDFLVGRASILKHYEPVWVSTRTNLTLPFCVHCSIMQVGNSILWSHPTAYDHWLVDFLFIWGFILLWTQKCDGFSMSQKKKFQSINDKPFCLWQAGDWICGKDFQLDTNCMDAFESLKINWLLTK